MTTIAVVMPHIDGRDALFEEAVHSVEAQTRQPDQFIVEPDPSLTGAAATQTRALRRVTSEWIALLGDDDYFFPEHLAILEAHATADVVWPDCQMLGRDDGYDLCREFEAGALRENNYIPGGGSLIRTEAARAVGGWCRPDDPDFHKFEDWVMWKRLLDIGASFRHVHAVTWAYRWGPHQTGGQA
jgi:CheY-like chemotaxis protein